LLLMMMLLFTYLHTYNLLFPFLYC